MRLSPYPPTKAANHGPFHARQRASERGARPPRPAHTSGGGPGPVSGASLDALVLAPEQFAFVAQRGHLGAQRPQFVEDLPLSLVRRAGGAAVR